MTENTKSRAGEFDALEKARPDELLFTLLERDPCAPPTIHFWCELRRKLAREIDDPDKRKDELRQITEAEFIAFAMADRGRGETPEDVLPQTYSGNVSHRSELDDLMPKLRAALGDADYHMHIALELARRVHGFAAIDDAQLCEIDVIASSAHAIALDISPHRAALLAESELPLEGSVE
jgi:hypothetical protein